MLRTERSRRLESLPPAKLREGNVFTGVSHSVHGGGVGTGRRGCRIYELYLPPLDMKPIPYPSPPPLVLTSNGGHRFTYGWQAGGMHPY